MLPQESETNLDAAEALKKFTRKFRLEELSIFHTDHWNVSVRPAQTTFGSLLLSLRRPCTSLGDLSIEEGQDFSRVTANLEALLQEATAYDRINYLCLMMVDAHVHFHVVPRFSQPFVLSESAIYTDASWPGAPDLSSWIEQPGIELTVRDFLSELLGA